MSNPILEAIIARLTIIEQLLDYGQHEVAIKKTRQLLTMVTRHHQNSTNYTKEDQVTLLSNSVERVINTAINILNNPGRIDKEDRQLNLDDWWALKSVTCRAFNDARNLAFIANNPNALGE